MTKTKQQLRISFIANTKIQITAYAEDTEFRTAVSYEESPLGVERTDNREAAEIAALTMLEQLGVNADDLDRLGVVLEHDGKLKKAKGQRSNSTLSVFLG